MWLLLAIASAFFLGFYDIFKKISLQENAVLPTLFLSTVCASLIMGAMTLSSTLGWVPEDSPVFVSQMSWEEHLKIILKTIIVLTSWICTYFALKNLPLTLFAPIRSTGPLWTILGAFFIFSEKLTLLQGAGAALIFIFFFLFSNTGKQEGISFRNNRYIWLMIIGTLMGSVSALYDRYLLREMEVMAVQAYFTFYQTLLLIPILLILWLPQRKNNTPFKWHWAIPLIGIFLLIGDFFYFYSIALSDSLISIISLVRRSNVVIVFAFGALFYKEKNVKKKGLFLLGIIAGLVLLVMGR